MKNVPDEKLFAMIVAEGSLNAFVELFERHWQKLFVVARTRLDDEDDSKDCVQEIFVTIWTKKEHLSIPLSVQAYLHTAVKNRVLNMLHSRVLRRNHIHSYLKEIETSQDLDHGSNDFDEMVAIVETEIAGMPEQMRKIYLLSRQENLSGLQIAEQLSLSHQTVRNQIGNAMKRIRESIQRYQTN